MILKPKKNEDYLLKADHFNKHIIPIEISGSDKYLLDIDYDELVKLFVDVRYSNFGNEKETCQEIYTRSILKLSEDVVETFSEVEEDKEENIIISLSYKIKTGEIINGLTIFFKEDDNGFVPQEDSYSGYHYNSGTAMSNIDIGIYDKLKEKYIYLLTMHGSFYHVEQVYVTYLLNLYYNNKKNSKFDDEISETDPEALIFWFDREPIQYGFPITEEEISEESGSIYCEAITLDKIWMKEKMSENAIDINLKLALHIALTISDSDDYDHDFIYAESDYTTAKIVFFNDFVEYKKPIEEVEEEPYSGIMPVSVNLPKQVLSSIL